MDIILATLAASLLMLNWGIYTRLTDARVLAKSLQVQLTGSLQSRYLDRLYRNLISVSVLFVVVIVVILIFLPIMYKVKGGLWAVPLLWFTQACLLVTFAEMFLINRAGWFRQELLLKRARVFNAISAALTLGIFCTAFF